VIYSDDMGSRPVYSADREVIEECQARGFEITARQLERWRPLLPDRIVEHEEGFRGSRSVNPPGYVDQVVAIAETLKSGIPLREVPLALFLRGFSVRLEVLRAAYMDLLARLRREVGTFTAQAGVLASEPVDQVDTMAAHMAARARRSTTGRRWEARARQAIRQRKVEADSVQALLSGVLSAALVGPFAGTPATSEGIAEVLEVFGLNDGQDPQQLADHLATMNLDAIAQAVETATLDQWVAARADLTEMLRYIELRRQIEALSKPVELRLTGLDDFFSQDVISRAAQVPALLIIATDEWRERLRSELAPLQALDSLLSVIPEKHHSPLLQNQLSAEAVKELRPRAQAWIEQHPREAKLLNIGANAGA
jgi:hypothetical protein